MLAWCEKLTLTPGALTAADLGALCAQGFADREVVSIALAAAYRNYITRVADGLGVELRRTADYTPEFIRAFGVDPAQARATLYADRTAAPGGPAGADSAVPRPGGDGQARDLPHARPAAAGQLPIGQLASAEPGQSPPAWVTTTPSAADAARWQAAQAEWLVVTGALPWVNLGRALATRPEALEALTAHARLVDFGGSGLERWQEALIGLLVGSTLDTSYVALHHAQMLLAQETPYVNALALLGRPDEHAHTTSGVARPLAAFCHKLAAAPGTMARADVESLRAAGFADAAIVTIVAAVAFQALLAGLSAGLGVTLEPGDWDDRLLERAE